MLSGGGVTGESLAVCRKYCGMYYVYYFDTSKYKGRDSLPPRDALLYGVLMIGEAQRGPDTAEFGCIAVCDGVCTTHDGSRYSLPSREIVADSIEIMARAHRMDGLVLAAFADAIREGRPTPIDVYDVAAWMATTALSEQSIALGSAPVAYPDFTNGAWMTRSRDTASGKYAL